MKKILSKFKLLFIFSLLLLICMGVEVKASSLSISTSATSVSPGESFTVTVSVSNGAGNVTTTVSNGTGGMTDWLDNSSYSFTCTAGSSGTVSISASGTVADYTTEVDESKSASASVSIISSSTTTDSTTTTTTTTTSSTSAPTLYNLGIDPYDFSGFSSNVTSYSVTVPNECTSVSIYAYSNNGTVTGTGTVTLSEGTNKFTVTVSNSSGSTAYTLSIIRETLDGDDVANSIEEDTEETSSEGIGLAGLTITGYTLEPEFDISTYEYTVTVDDELTLEDLEEIKDKVTAITNTDSVYTEITAGISEDEIATITITVKDDEKEYSVYTIYFEQAVEAVTATSTSADESEYITLVDMEYFTKKVYLITCCMTVSILIALFYAISSYKKSKYIEKYIMENDEYKDEDEEENFEELVEEFKKKDFEDNMGVPDLSILSNEKEANNDNSEIAQTENKDDNEIKDSREYKKPRKGSGSGGKH